MESYCSKCDKLVQVSVQKMKEVFNVKGKKIPVLSQVAVCDDCSSKLFNQELDDKNIKLVYSNYRKEQSLLSPNEIENIRRKYSLSQRALGRLLGWGEITINRYESGAIQDTAHNEVLMFIQDPRNMKELFEQNSQELSKTTREILRKKIEEALTDSFKSQLETYISAEGSIDEYSGFTAFSLEKIINMIVYITEKTKGEFLTKLNKLLWYSDFLNFKKYSKSISGSNYVHLPLGPIPDGYGWIINAAIDEGLIIKEAVEFSEGYIGERHIAITSADESLFTELEKVTMDFVISFFKDYTAKQIRNSSHDEKAYKETEANEKISYKYAADLSLDLNVK